VNKFKKHIRIIIFLWALFPFIIGGALMTGSADIQAGDWLDWCRGLIGSDSTKGMIMQLRFLRLCTAFGAGAVLSLCGLYMQAMVRNPLADPYLLGASSGAGFGVVLITTGLIPFALFQSVLFVPLIAFAGSLLSLIIVLGIGYMRKDNETYRLLISGIAVSSFFTALTGLIIYRFSDNDNLRTLLFWTLGSFNRSTVESAWMGMSALGLAFLFGWIRSRQLDVLILGEEQAGSLGLNTRKFRIEILLVCALSAGIVSAFSGPVGFVGLMIPHFSRGWLGASHRRNILVIPCLGGLYLVTCDWLGRFLLPPAGLPIGIITALLGIPFFLFLLNRKFTSE